MKRVGLFVFLMMVLASLGVFAQPLPVDIDWVEVENVELEATTSTFRETFDRDEEIEVRVRLTVPSSVPDDLEDVTLTVFLSGYEFDTISDSERIHRMKPGRAYTEELNLRLPQLMDKGDYKLRVMVTDKDSETLVEEYDIDVTLEENLLAIRDVVFFEDETVRPGESLYSVVRVENFGDDDEENVKVSVSIPELGIRTADFMDEIESGDSESSTELYLRIPEDAKAGEYDAEVKLEYNEFESTSKMYTVTVLDKKAPSADDESPKTLVSAAIEPQSVQVGSTAVYPITISNLADNAKTYTLTVESASDWASFKVNPSNLVLLEPREAKTLYLYVTPQAGADETNLFVVSINDGEEKQQGALQADVEAGTEAGTEDSGNFSRALEVSLIVLVVILVIVGLIVAFTKLASRDEDEDEDEDETTQTYY